MAGLGGLQVSGAGHLPASAAARKDGSRTPWQARRAPPEAVLIGKRRDPPLPLTGISGNAQGARTSANGTARPSRGEPGVIVPVAIAEEERRQGRYRVL